MSKSKVLLILVMFLLVFQSFGQNVAHMAETSKVQQDDSSILKINVVEQNEDQIRWKVVLNEGKKELDEMKTKVSIGAGQTHGQIETNSNANVKKAASGYVIETSEDNSTYEFSIMTTIQDSNQSTFQLKTETTDGEKSYQASAQVEMQVEPVVEEVTEKPDEKEPEKTQENEGDAAQPEAEGAADEEVTNEAEVDSVVKQKEEESLYEKVLATLKSKPLDEFTEDEVRKLFEGLTEEELQMLEKEFQTDEEIGVIDPNFKPFVVNRNQQRMTLMSYPTWPAPGAVKLNGKDASATGNYGEWEIELSVEAKDIDTSQSTDVVLLLDRSGSMQGNRLARAKNAAILFVNELLEEDAQTRIALVTFGENAQTNSNFRGANQKQPLINSINGISASGGTNIQAGLRTANNLIANTSANNKIIVLLSDGEPTYSYRANNATGHSWAHGNYNFRLSNFSNTTRGNGSSYNLPTGFLGIGDQRYTVNGHRVTTNGSGTISEAWGVMTNNIDMYSIGLDVGNNNNATNVLKNSQNKGYYQAGVDDLSGIFSDIAGEIKYAATNAVVTDPLGEMFKLVKGKYNGNDYEASDGTVTWNETNKTFSWNIGDIKQDEKPKLKYTVTIDWEHPDLKGHVDYPMNKETPLNYRDMNGNNATKYFDIPKGQIGKGKIKKFGYRVNPAGEPVGSNGNVVSSIEEAEKFYDVYYGDLHDFGAHSVPADDVTDYTLLVGDNPTAVTIGQNNPVETAYFGYVKTSDLPAAAVTAKYVDENGEELVPDVIHTGNIGDPYETEQKDIPGYEYIGTHEDSADESGSFTTEEQTVIYVYKKSTGTIKIVKVDKDDANLKLPDAKFNVLDSEDVVVDELETDENGEATTISLPVGDYKIVEVEAPTSYEIATSNLTVTVKAGKETVKKIKNKKLKGSLKVIKQDADGNGLLPGATFELRDANDNMIGNPQTTEGEGEIIFTDLAWGTYTLTETKAPEGYRLLTEEITIEIKKDDLHVTETVENSLIGWEIPKTGGIGTIGFYLAGLLLMIGAAGFVIRRRIA